MSSESGTIYGMAGLLASLHSLMYLAKAGLTSPTDIEITLDGIAQVLDRLTPELRAKSEHLVDPLLAEIKMEASNKWKGE